MCTILIRVIKDTPVLNLEIVWWLIPICALVNLVNVVLFVTWCNQESNHRRTKMATSDANIGPKKNN